MLDHDRLDLAVARGAAYYGMVRRGAGVRIAADLARTYYIGVEANESSPTGVGSYNESALCLVPASAEAGQEIELADRDFQLLVSEPVEFPLYTSSTRLTDRPGELVAVDRERMTALAPMRTVLKARGRASEASVSVRLHARLTEIGTLDLWAAEARGPRSWRLQFDVRSATQTDMAAHRGTGEMEGFVDEATWKGAWREIERTFGQAAIENPEGIIKRLSAALATSKQDWPMSLLRRIWEALVDSESGRRRTAAHEGGGSICWATRCDLAMVLRLMIGASRRRGSYCTASWSTRRRCASTNGGFSGGGSREGSPPDSSRRWPIRCWRRSAGCTRD